MAILKIDVDRNFLSFDDGKFNDKLRFLSDVVGLKISNWRLYKSKGDNIHVKVDLEDELSDLEVLCLQAILGSDWRREAFNLRRIRRGQKNWNILFDHKEIKINNGVEKIG